ncbi:MAG: hypothetical protein ACLQU3_33320 [Limisphaerales bacterium]
MKTLPGLIIAISCVLSSSAQTRSVLEMGPHHALYSSSDGSPGGAPTLVLETGLYYWSADAQQWLPADPSFSINATGDAFVANKTLGQLRASAQINTAGAITVNLDPQDATRQLVTSPVAIAIEEPATGTRLVIGTITNSIGALVEGTTNQIIYEDCFAGVCASYVVEVERGTYSADVLFTGKLDVRDWGFTTNARVLIFSEIYGPPPDSSIRRPLYIEQDPQKIAQAAQLGLSLDVIDETLCWGNLVMAEGSAYTAATATATNGASVNVAKQIETGDGRLFLVESLAFASLQDQFLSLPECTPPGGHARLNRPNGAKFRYAGIPRLPSSPVVALQPSSEPAVPSATPKRTLPLQARIARRPAGVCVDYIANLGGTLSTPVTFQSSTNVLITGSLYLNGAVTFEPIIVKYKTNAFMQINNTLTLKNFGQFRGAQFTAVDDNSVGDTCAGITNSGYTGVIANTGYANPAIYTAQSSLSLTNCRFSYAKLAVQCIPSTASSSTYNFSHSQLVNCITGIQLGAAGCGSWGCGVTVALNANNCLMANVTLPFSICLTNPPLGLGLANCTLDRAIQIAQRASGGFSLNARNCIFSNITNTSPGVTFAGAYNGFYSSAQQFGTAQSTVTNSPFQSVGAGNYYLTIASGFANAGTNAGIPAWLQADLGKRTTYPPTVVCDALLCSDQTLSSQVPRDTSVCSLGMHYDPMDWALGWVLLTNATISVNPGTVIAAFGTNAGGTNIAAYGLAIGQNAALQCQGAPNAPNWFVAYNTVQEQGTNTGGWIPPSSGLLLSEFQGLTPGSVINCRFTHWSVPSLDEPGFNAPTNSGPLTFQDCEFHGGKLLSSSPTIDLTNCLLERVYANLSSADTNSPYIRNSLFYGGIFNFAPNVTNALVKDNLFDQTAIPTNTAIYTTYNGGYNAYVTNNNRLLPLFATDKILTGTPAYQTGPLGNYYYPTNGPSGGLTNLFNTGSTWATNVGLYHYTTTTNQVVEGSTMLDIGYHYVAVDANGNPLDTDGDGIPDYLEDTNGDGAYDSGDLSNWKVADTDGDGVNDYVEWIQGRNPRVAGTVSDSNNRINLQVYTPLTGGGSP